eukprot:5040052-Pyramimonas_sp.AAC.1
MAPSRSLGFAVVVGCLDARYSCHPSVPECWIIATACVQSPTDDSLWAPGEDRVALAVGQVHDVHLVVRVGSFMRPLEKSL